MVDVVAVVPLVSSFEISVVLSVVAEVPADVPVVEVVTGGSVGSELHSTLTAQSHVWCCWFHNNPSAHECTI